MSRPTYELSNYGSGSAETVSHRRRRFECSNFCPPTVGNGDCPPTKSGSSRKRVFADDGSVLTVELWKPIAVIVLQISFLSSVFASSRSFSHGVEIPLSATVAYLAFIWIGMKWMKDRSPFRIKGWIFSYNLYQVGLNAYAVVSLCLEARRAGFRVWGNPAPDADGASSPISFLIFLHYQNKYVELIDTVFMVLRKKQSQITSLHVYHHLLLLWAWYFVMNVAPGGDAYFGALVNSATHVPLYAYYALSILGYECPWKIMLTALQIAQFVVCATHALYCAGADNYPMPLLVLNVFVQVNMLILFGHFCCTAYRVRREQRTGELLATKTPVSPSKNDEISLAEVRRHCTPSDCWCAIHGNVLDITTFLSKHPGGDVITLSAGREATVLAETYHPNGIPKSVLEKYRIGRVPPSEIGTSYYSWSSPFYKTLRRRVVDKIRSLRRSRRGGHEIWIKAVALLFGFATCTYLMCVLDFVPAIGAAVALGVVSAKIGTCVQHDGNHGAFAESSFLNRLAGWTLDLIGASAMTWEVQHVLGHHAFTNVLDMRNGPSSHARAANVGDKTPSGSVKLQEESDPDVFGSYPLMRMHPVQPRKWFHKYQHLYGPVIFALMTLSKSYQQDVDVFRNWRLLHLDASCRYSVASYRWRFVIMKILSMGYMIALPMYVHGVARGLGLWLVAHLTAGETLATFFIVNHVIEGVSYVSVSKESTTSKKSASASNLPKTNEGHCPMSDLAASKGTGASEAKHDPVPLNDWAAVQCQTSVNWSSGSWFWNHVSGGLNHQIEHHLFPSICHTNYVHIQPVVEATCKEFGVPYQTESNLWVAYWKMIRHLRSLGNGDSDSGWHE